MPLLSPDIKARAVLHAPDTYAFWRTPGALEAVKGERGVYRYTPILLLEKTREPGRPRDLQMLYYAESHQLAAELHSEIERITLFQELPRE